MVRIMKTYDNRIKYIELLMKYDDISDYKNMNYPKDSIMNFINQEMKKIG